MVVRTGHGQTAQVQSIARLLYELLTDVLGGVDDGDYALDDPAWSRPASQ